MRSGLQEQVVIWWQLLVQCISDDVQNIPVKADGADCAEEQTAAGAGLGGVRRSLV